MQRSATQVLLNWTASTDNHRVAKYIVTRNGQGQVVVTNPSATDPWPGSQPSRYCVQAVDVAGNRSAAACVEG